MAEKISLNGCTTTQVFGITTRSRLTNLTATLHRISGVLKDSSRKEWLKIQTCDIFYRLIRWRVNRHLSYVFDESQVRILILYNVVVEYCVDYSITSHSKATRGLQDVTLVILNSDQRTSGQSGPSGQSHQLVDGMSLQTVMPLMIHYVEELMHVETIEAQTSSLGCGVDVRRGGCHLRCLPRHLTMAQNDQICCQYPSPCCFIVKC
ncbi:hypothetical protein TNCV_2305081 [Trichonephila clavipes]|nr:hypothetical protein TNCV_2305081 [Trichonephila clavipes]